MGSDRQLNSARLRLSGSLKYVRLDKKIVNVCIVGLGYVGLPLALQFARSLSDINIGSAVELFGNYAGHSKDMAGYLKDAQINHDSNLKLQYLAGLGLNLYQSDGIYKNMIRESRYPDDGLFTGSPQTMAVLRQTIEQSLGR